MMSYLARLQSFEFTVQRLLVTVARAQDVCFSTYSLDCYLCTMILSICYHRLLRLLSWRRDYEYRNVASATETSGLRYRSILTALLLLLALVSIQQIQTLSHMKLVERVISEEKSDSSHGLDNGSLFFLNRVDSRSSRFNIDGITSAPSSNISSSTSKIYFFPKKPMFQAQAMVEEAIGPKILRDPQRNPLRNCSVSVQFHLTVPPPKHSSNTLWVLQSMMAATDQGNTTVVPKLYGGDELYVEWQSAESTEMGVAHVKDQKDGTYLLEFVRPPIQQSTPSEFASSKELDVGRLTIYYDYTCWIGSLLAPHKNAFARAGEVHSSFSHEGIPRPYIKHFVSPNKDHAIDLSSYDTVIAFGDSLMMQLARRYMKNEFWSPNIMYTMNVGQCLSDPVKDVDTLLQKFHSWHGDYLTQAANRSERVAVIAGSAVWDAMRGCVRRNFNNHKAAIRSFVTSIQADYPKMDLYWKSPSPVLLHRRSSLKELLNDTVWLQNSRYMSDSIPRQLYSVQKELMKELDIPLLDLWDAYYLSGPWTRPGDARHYLDDISFLLLSYFWPGLTGKA